MVNDDDPPRRAVAVIRTDLAGSRRWRYEINMQGLARRFGFEIAGVVALTAATKWPTVEILRAVCRTGASAVIAPSAAHVTNPRIVTEFVPLYVVGRGRIYRRGHRWRSR